MAPSGKVVSTIAPLKNRLVCDLSCRKCNRKVCNGILCDFCDKWYHFKCACITDNELPDENTEWMCRLCIGLNVDRDISKEDSVETLKEIISVLKSDLEEVQKQNDVLKSNCMKSDMELGKCHKDVSTTCLGNITEHNIAIGSPNQSPFRGWEAVPLKKSCKPIIGPQDNSKPYPSVSNRFSVLQKVESFNDAREEVGLGSDTHKSNHNRPNYNRPRNTIDDKGRSSDLNKSGPRLTTNKSLLSLREKHRLTKKKPKGIKLYSDSFGRGVATLIAEEDGLGKDFNVEGNVKPSAKFKDVVSTLNDGDKLNLGSQDFVILMAGANDVSQNNTEGAINMLKDSLQGLKHTNVIVVNVPHRHDLIHWSCVNKEVNKANLKYKEICSGLDNVHLIDVENFDRSFHTTHGQHLNRRGKQALADIIGRIISNVMKSSSSNLIPASQEFSEELANIEDSTRTKGQISFLELSCQEPNSV